jgi:hypothetical protein
VSAVGFVSAKLEPRYCPAAIIDSALWFCQDACPREYYYNEEDWHLCLCLSHACNVEYLQESCVNPSCQSHGGCVEIASYGRVTCTDREQACPAHRIGDGFCDSQCDVPQYQYDGGDCAECSPGCVASYLGDGRCDLDCNTRLCNYDEGDCAAQCRPGCSDQVLGDGFCDAPCNFEECQFDRGDCEELCSPGCQRGYLGDSFCDRACNNEQCNFDHGDCSFCDDDDKCPLSWLGDGVCDAVCDNVDCSNDNGDCGGNSGPTAPPEDPEDPVPDDCVPYVENKEIVVTTVWQQSVDNCYDKFSSLADRVGHDQLQQEYLADQQAALDLQSAELSVLVLELEQNATVLEEASAELGLVLVELDEQYAVLEGAGISLLTELFALEYPY